MNKRMTEIHKLGKKNEALITSGGLGAARDDEDAEVRAQELQEAVDENMKSIDTKHADFRVALDVMRGSLGNKVHQEELKQLEERFEKRLGLIDRDLRLKGKKIALLMNERSDDSPNKQSKKSLHDSKKSLDM